MRNAFISFPFVSQNGENYLHHRLALWLILMERIYGTAPPGLQPI